MPNLSRIIEKLYSERRLSRPEYRLLLEGYDKKTLSDINTLARKTALGVFGNQIFIRGLIEITNRCRNNCYYCGLRRDDKIIERYSLSREQILDCCRTGYAMGFRTFVLQGGEGGVGESFVEQTVRQIKTEFPEAAITLSLGEFPREVYQRWFDAGADRYLLRHETADKSHYELLHPSEMSFENRRRCLADLKSIGYQTGAGFMVGSPFQTIETIIDDIEYIDSLQPEMLGIGPFLPQSATPMADFPAGSEELTLLLVSVFRLMMPEALIPATTALASVADDGRVRGILAGANVVMPNLSPSAQRLKYAIYDNKKSFNLESAEGLAELEQQLNEIGYRISDSRGDHPKKQSNVQS